MKQYLIHLDRPSAWSSLPRARWRRFEMPLLGVTESAALSRGVDAEVAQLSNIAAIGDVLESAGLDYCSSVGGLSTSMWDA